MTNPNMQRRINSNEEESAGTDQGLHNNSPEDLESLTMSEVSLKKNFIYRLTNVSLMHFGF